MDAAPRYRAVLLLYHRLSPVAKQRLGAWAAGERHRGAAVWYVYASDLAAGGVVAYAFAEDAPDEPARFYAGADGALGDEAGTPNVITHLGCTPREHRAFLTAHRARLLAWDRQWQGEG